MDDSGNFATVALRRWFDSSSALFESCGLCAEFRTNLGGSASVRLDSDTLIVDATAWDNASCLDIEILRVETEKSHFLHVGECVSREVFEFELRRFENELKRIAAGGA